MFVYSLRDLLARPLDLGELPALARLAAELEAPAAPDTASSPLAGEFTSELISEDEGSALRGARSR